MARDVFISYRHEDQEWANRISQALEARNISCWIAFRDIPPGADWPAEIMDGLQQSRFFVLVLSSHSIYEEQISREVRIAADALKLPIFPFRIEDVQPPKKISYFLGDIQWLDAFNGRFDSAISQLVERIQGAPATAPSPARITNVNPTAAAKKPFLWIGAAVAAVIIIALIVYFATRPAPGPQPLPQSGQDAAYLFLNDLNAGNFKGAWNEFTPERKKKGKESQWVDEERSARQTNGSFSYTLNSCPALPGGKEYACDFTLKYGTGKTGPANITIEQEENGSWGVASATLRKPQ